MAKELSEHCGKAHDAINRAAYLVTARIPDTKQLSAQLNDAKKSMASCMTMVHCVEENAFGAEAEKKRDQK